MNVEVGTQPNNFLPVNKVCNFCAMNNIAITTYYKKKNFPTGFPNISLTAGTLHKAKHSINLNICYLTSIKLSNNNLTLCPLHNR